MMVSAIHQHESAIDIHMSPSIEPPSHLSPILTPLGYHRVLGLCSLCHTANSHWLSTFHTQYICFSAILSNYPNFFLPNYVQKSVLYVWISLAASFCWHSQPL